MTAGEVLVFFGSIGIIVVLFNLNKLTARLLKARSKPASESTDQSED